MPLSYKIENDILEFKICCEFTRFDFERNLMAAIIDSAFNPPMKTMIDLVQAESSITTDDLKIGAMRIGELKDYIAPHAAVLAKPKSLLYGLARIFSIYAEEEGMMIEVFTERSKALNYLTTANAA